MAAEFTNAVGRRERRALNLGPTTNKSVGESDYISISSISINAPNLYTGTNAQNLKKWLPTYSSPRASSRQDFLSELIKNPNKCWSAPTSLGLAGRYLVFCSLANAELTWHRELICSVSKLETCCSVETGKPLQETEHRLLAN